MTIPDHSADASRSNIGAADSGHARTGVRTTLPSWDAPRPTPGFTRIAASSSRSSAKTPRQTVFQRNRPSVIALCVVAAYIILAETTGVVMFGIFPALLGIRAFRRNEQFAPLALVAAGIAVIFAVTALSHR